MLDEEFEAVRTELRKRVQDEYNITVNVDGWDDAAGKSVYTCNMVFTNRRLHRMT